MYSYSFFLLLDILNKLMSSMVIFADTSDDTQSRLKK